MQHSVFKTLPLDAQNRLYQLQLYGGRINDIGNGVYFERQDESPLRIYHVNDKKWRIVMERRNWETVNIETTNFGEVLTTIWLEVLREGPLYYGMESFNWFAELFYATLYRYSDSYFVHEDGHIYAKYRVEPRP